MVKFKTIYICASKEVCEEDVSHERYNAQQENFKSWTVRYRSLLVVQAIMVLCKELAEAGKCAKVFLVQSLYA